MKRPSFQFYPREWLTDSNLAACSIESRGLWIALLAVMHGCKPYGHLALNNAPMTDINAAQQTMVPVRTYKRCIAELIAKGVARQNDDGIIYSARMIKDEAAREYQANSGSLSMMNPNVPRPKQFQSKQDTPGDIPPGPSRAVSSAFAVASIYKKGSMLGQSAKNETESKATANATSTPADIQPDSQKQTQGNGEGYTPPPPPISTVPLAPPARMPWFRTADGIMRKGKAIDLPPEDGESSEHYRDRISARLRDLQGDH